MGEIDPLAAEKSSIKHRVVVLKTVPLMARFCEVSHSSQAAAASGASIVDRGFVCLHQRCSSGDKGWPDKFLVPRAVYQPIRRLHGKRYELGIFVCRIFGIAVVEHFYHND